MLNKEIILISALIFLAFTFGCVGGVSEVNETKLEVTQGVGVVGQLKMDELHPGLDGYVTLTVRNNLGGESAKDVIVALDNVYPFKIFECGAPREGDELREDCPGDFPMDKDLRYRQHGIPRILPGEEVEVYWRLRAPSQEEISRIALKHPLYYDIEFTYRTNFHQNLIFMSLQEKLRREQAEEEYLISGESGMGAGELRIEGKTNQPIIYQFSYPDDSAVEEPPFSFTVKYSVENKGSGYPLSDIILLLEYPEGIEPTENVTETYGWEKWDESDGKYEVLRAATTTEAETFMTNRGCQHIEGNVWRCECRTGEFDKEGNEITKNCKDWAMEVIGDEDFNKLDEDKLLIKIIDREDFVKSFNVYAPLQITGDEMTNLKIGNVPLKIYIFNIHTIYRYFIEGKDYITVYPIRTS